jgi:hypothetical protein
MRRSVRASSRIPPFGHVVDMVGGQIPFELPPQGLVRCGRCGSMMAPAWSTNGAGKPYHYYQCTRRSHVGKDGCDARSVPAQALERPIVEVIEWHEGRERPVAGHYRIGYFEQPRLDFPKTEPAEQTGSVCSAGNDIWLRRQGSNLRPSG